MTAPARHTVAPPFATFPKWKGLGAEFRAWKAVARFLASGRARARTVNAVASRIAYSVAGASVRERMVERMYAQIGHGNTAFNAFTPEALAASSELCLRLADECRREALTLAAELLAHPTPAEASVSLSPTEPVDAEGKQ
jgi:hypothetical protein